MKTAQTTLSCILVQDGWCKRVFSINKTHLNKWEKEDKKHVIEAKKVAQDCKPAMGPELELKKHKASCVNHSCLAVPLPQ